MITVAREERSPGLPFTVRTDNPKHGPWLYDTPTVRMALDLCRENYPGESIQVLDLSKELDLSEEGKNEAERIFRGLGGASAAPAARAIVSEPEQPFVYQKVTGVQEVENGLVLTMKTVCDKGPPVPRWEFPGERELLGEMERKRK